MQDSLVNHGAVRTHTHTHSRTHSLVAAEEVKVDKSAISLVIQGTFRSTIAYKGGARSITLQPFFVLQADVQVWRLREAYYFVW